MKINKFSIKKGAFKKRIHIANAIMVIIMVSCILLFNIINTLSVNQYSETLKSLKSLRSFYGNITNATAFIKDYLYTENKVALQKYNKHLSQAYKDMNVLKEASLNTDYYRFIMLENMVGNYEQIAVELVAQYKNNKDDYTQAYNKFLNTGALIEKTSGDYYSCITEAVNAQLENLKTIKKSTENISLVLLGILLGWLMYYSYQLTKSITKPLEEILTNINRVKEGKYDLSDVSDASNEMKALCDAMSEMAHSVQKNIETTREKGQLEKQLLEWKNDNLKKDELLAQSELKMLQNQINPHFLFNTLNMIYKMSVQAGANDAADVLIKTAHLLRYGLDKQNRLSDIKSEVEMLKNYIEIQTIRLGKRVSFAISFENADVIGRVQIPGMILQPLVENAIKHGLKNCMNDGVIEVNISGSSSLITIVIGDNGSGMNSDDLEKFIINDYHKNGENHLGLYNVVKRLQMYYQDRVTISINSDTDCGFEIFIEIKLSK